MTISNFRLFLSEVNNILRILRDSGIQPTPQRMVVVGFVLRVRSHPTAEQVLEAVRIKCPTISRATVYNTLNLLTEKKLIKAQVLKEGTVVFDSNIKQHHHCIDEETGHIFDVPWDALKVTGEKSLKGFDVREYQVILRGKKK